MNYLQGCFEAEREESFKMENEKCDCNNLEWIRAEIWDTFHQGETIVHEFFYSTVIFNKILHDINFPFLYCDIKNIKWVEMCAMQQ